MTVEMLIGTVLVLLTWLACLGALIALGSVPALVLDQGGWRWRTARSAVWWGVLAAAVWSILLNLVVPLGSPAAAVSTVVLVLVAGVAGLAWALSSRRARGGPARDARAPVPRWTWPLVAAFALAIGYVAVAALGPVTNFDTGLYHLGAIAYATEYSAIPGLANIFFPMGYANAQFPMAALLGNGPWEGEGYRLLNGLLIALLAIDAVMRIRDRRLGVGFFVLTAGAAVTLVPMVALSDYLVTSPTADSAVLVLTVVATAYLADALARDRNWLANGATALAVSYVLVMLRPTMGAFAATVVLVLVIRAVRLRGSARSAGLGIAAVLTGLFGVLAGAAVVVRDYVLSGWLLYPLSVLPFDVAWRAPDPINDRLATLGNARDPANLWEAAHGWGWIPAWLDRLPDQWETYLVVLASAAAVVTYVLARRSGAMMRGGRTLLLAMLPSAVAVAGWWLLSPPSFRFAWGPLFTLATIPLGWSVWALCCGSAPGSRASRTWPWVVSLGVAAPVVAVTVFSAGFRFDADAVTQERTWDLGVSIPYAVAPVEVATVVEYPLASGLLVLDPQGGSCWASFPLCSPMVNGTVRLRGESLQDGLLP